MYLNLNFHIEKPLSKYTTVGIMEAATEVLRRYIVNKTIRIFSDGKAALRALEGYKIILGVVLKFRNT